MKSTILIRTAGLIGIFASLFGLCCVLASTFLAGSTFSWNTNALSDIGVSAITLAADIFNISLLVTGILNFIFALGFTKANARNALFFIGGALLILGGFSLSLVGIFTEAYGRLHFYVSAAYFSLFSLALIMNGLAFHKAEQGGRGNVSILAGLISGLVVLSATATGWHTWLGLGFAVPEIIASIIFAAWTIWMGINLFAARGK